MAGAEARRNIQIKQYEKIRFILLLAGIILYYTHYLFIIVGIPYISFLFGNISFYMISPAIPILIAIGYAIAYLELYLP